LPTAADEREENENHERCQQAGDGADEAEGKNLVHGFSEVAGSDASSAVRLVSHMPARKAIWFNDAPGR
jgi:hypothetical protein